MTWLAFLIGLVALLATPGPTNTLLALGGASRGGVRPALSLLAAELAAYLAAIILVGLLAGFVFEMTDPVRMALQLVAAAYLVVASVRLWRRGAVMPGAGIVTARMVALTTLGNPKAVIIALALMPRGWAGDPALALPALAGIAVVVPLIGSLWVMAGVLLARGGGAQARALMPRVSSLALAAFALMLARTALAG